MQKADKTKDEVYEEFVSNFKRQEVLRNYYVKNYGSDSVNSLLCELGRCW